MKLVKYLRAYLGVIWKTNWMYLARIIALIIILAAGSFAALVVKGRGKLAIKPLIKNKNGSICLKSIPVFFYVQVTMNHIDYPIRMHRNFSNEMPYIHFCTPHFCRPFSQIYKVLFTVDCIRSRNRGT